MSEQPVAMKIASIKDEAEGIRIFHFEEKLDAEPGQFIMLWIPGINMKPFGISGKGSGFDVTISNVGDFTEKIFELEAGDLVGIQGPYGRAFTVPRSAILVGGGYGTAPLAFLADEIIKSGGSATFITGAKTEKLLTYRKRFQKSAVKTIYCTDDGTFGRKGFVTDALREELKTGKPQMICTCGPEIMMKKVIEISDEEDVMCEASLERYMKCGFGICGQCCVDDSGTRVCTEGPVFSKEFIKENISEFGMYKRDCTGKRT